MPKFLEDKLKAKYGEKSDVPYKIMNAIGAMHGSKTTAKGEAMQAKHDEDVKAGKAYARGGSISEEKSESAAERRRERKEGEEPEGKARGGPASFRPGPPMLRKPLRRPMASPMGPPVGPPPGPPVGPIGPPGMKSCGKVKGFAEGGLPTAGAGSGPGRVDKAENSRSRPKGFRDGGGTFKGSQLTRGFCKGGGVELRGAKSISET